MWQEKIENDHAVLEKDGKQVDLGAVLPSADKKKIFNEWSEGMREFENSPDYAAYCHANGWDKNDNINVAPWQGMCDKSRKLQALLGSEDYQKFLNKQR